MFKILLNAELIYLNPVPVWACWQPPRLRMTWTNQIQPQPSAAVPVLSPVRNQNLGHLLRNPDPVLHMHQGRIRPSVESLVWQIPQLARQNLWWPLHQTAQLKFHRLVKSLLPLWFNQLALSMEYWIIIIFVGYLTCIQGHKMYMYDCLEIRQCQYVLEMYVNQSI